MIIYIENPKKSTKKKTKKQLFLNELSRMAGYKSIIQKQFYFYILSSDTSQTLLPPKSTYSVIPAL